MKKSLFLSLAILLSVSTAIAQQVTLKFDPAKGAKYKMSMATDMDMTMDVMGQSMPMKMVMGMTYLQTITDKSATAITIKNEFDVVKINMTTPMGGGGYDSSNPDATDPMFGAQIQPVAAAILHKPFTMVMTPQGKVQSVKGISELMSAGNVNPQFATQFSDDAIKSMMENAFQAYPSTPVKVGDTWKGSIKQPMQGMGDLTFDITYKLVSVTGDEATIDIAAALSTSGNANLAKLSGDMTGKNVLSVKTGITKSGTMKLTIKGTISSQGMDMGVNGTSTTTTTTTQL